jgi:hypothetical protein
MSSADFAPTPGPLHGVGVSSRRKVDVCLVSPAGEIVDEWASPPDGDGLRGLAARAAM